MATFYLDYEGGNDANDGTTFANRWKTITTGATAARIAPGDTIRIMGSPAPTSLGINTTWTNMSPTVTLASALTQSISLCNAAWTASTNVTTAINTDRKEGTHSTSIAPAAAFTTGKAARESFATLDLSGYQQVSFWIKQTAGTVAIAGDLTLRLCSDTAGDVTVNTIAIPALAALSRWIPITVDTGVALGSSIQSVALYVAVDRGAQTFLLDNIMACKASSSADALCLVSLIGKPNSVGAGGTDTETWYGIRSINGTTVTLDQSPNLSAANTPRGYYGTSETVTGYRRVPIRTTMGTALTTSIQEVQDSGTSGNLINFEGGWDRTAMTTQNLETWFDGGNGFGRGLILIGKSFVSVNKLSFVRYANGVNLQSSSANNTFDNLTVNNNSEEGMEISSSNSNTVTKIRCHSNESNGLGVLSGSSNTFTSIKADSNNNSGITMTGATSNIFTTILSASNNGGNVGALSVSNSSGNTFTTITKLDDNTDRGLYFDTTCNNNYFASIGSINGNTQSGIYLVTQCNNNRFASIDTVNDNGAKGIYLVQECHNNQFDYVGQINGNVIGIEIFIGSNNSFKVADLSDNSTYGIIIDGFCNYNMFSVSTSLHGTAAVSIDAGHNFFRNSIFAETTKVTGFLAFEDGRIFSKNDQNVVGAFKIYCDGGDIVTDTTTVHTSPGISWKMSPTSTNRSSSYPLELSLARIAVNANLPVTVKAWTRRNNTGLTTRLIAKGGQLNGVGSDVTATITAAADMWEQLTITFTPSESGTVEILGQAWGGTTFNGWWDDLTVT